MQPTKELIDEIFWQRVRKARQMSPEDKLMAGPRLFEMASKIMADGIRARFPGADDRRVLEILRDQLAMIRRREDNR